MSAETLVSVFIIIAMFGFFALSLRKAWKFAHMQIHARLDLYPVPKEGAGRAAYGGSYMEEPEWWTKPRKIDRVSETVDIMKEMLFIKKLFVHQRTLWWASYSMHLGIYVMLGWSVLLLISVAWHPAWYVAAVFAIGVVGFVLATVGCLLLLVRRVSDRVLAKYTTPLEYFNIVLLLVVLLTGAYSWLFVASPFTVAAQVFTLSAANLPVIVLVHFVLLGIMFLYIPLSKMSHYVGKFFCFHKVLWDNDPNLKGSAVERRFEDAAEQPVTSPWSATKPQSPSSETSKG
ncbi:nitrate reductase gamma subunit [Gordonibacter sp. 28C]|uniref:respiratory nitrate reductase subunit gamma n=1 Tax=Gordonibacter sp. 28C TaxID=2078569 RepID=UPI000DF82CDF|nr:respiratory nitrate reductase subunit gamma [Gordonibacter sp. 28C]RDB61489.1 nitrate reductase gamma subunit [Gordonibacter sp. 28C]